MAIRILPKYGSKVPEPEPDKNQPELNIFEAINKKLRYERENIQPFLGDNLFPYYEHSCILYISGKYVGQGYGTYTDRIELYDQIGEIFRNI